MKAKLVPIYFKSADDPDFSAQLKKLHELLVDEAEILEPVLLGAELPETDGVIFPQMLGEAYRELDKIKKLPQPLMIVTSEFGTVQDPVELRALLAMSTYHAIKDNTAYPGVLLIHGINDPRVDVWHSSKTAARLQAASAQVPGAKPALLRLDMQAGHGVGSTLTQRQAMAADIQSFLLWQMGKVGLRD